MLLTSSKLPLDPALRVSSLAVPPLLALQDRSLSTSCGYARQTSLVRVTHPPISACCPSSVDNMARYHFVFLFATLTLFVKQAFGAWPNHNLSHCVTNPENYKKVEDFTVQWFLDKDNILAGVKRRYKRTDGNLTNALFYTRGMSETARKYACNEKLITIWDVWEAELYDPSNSSGNAFSCIHHDDTARNYFFGNMSEAFATLSTGIVYVMHNISDFLTPPEDGIWAMVERKKIFSHETTVELVTKMNGTDKSTGVAIWHYIEGVIDDSVELGKDTVEVVKRIGGDPVAWWTYVILKAKSLKAQTKVNAKRDVAQVFLGKTGRPLTETVHEDEEEALSCRMLPAYTLEVNW